VVTTETQTPYSSDVGAEHIYPMKVMRDIEQVGEIVVLERRL